MSESTKYSGYIAVSGEGTRFGLMTCLRCGAVVMVEPGENRGGEHDIWHDMLTANIELPDLSEWIPEMYDDAGEPVDPEVWQAWQRIQAEHRRLADALRTVARSLDGPVTPSQVLGIRSIALHALALTTPGATDAPATSLEDRP